MKKIITLVGFVLLLFHCTAFAQKSSLSGTEKVPQHPRLLLLKGEEKTIKKNIRKYPFWRSVHEKLIHNADSVMRLPLNEYKKQGRRLHPAYANFRNIFLMGYAYRMTGQRKYAQRIEAEMLKGAAWPDWNPSHFLDVSEMTAGMSIGYDWLYHYLSPASRKIIETAIIEKGIKPSYNSAYNWFLKANSNWNQVCNAGMGYGSIAIWDVDKELAVKTLNRSIEKIKLPMKEYAPDGAYPEGVSYWDFGTLWNVMLLSALDKTFQTDFGLSDLPGFKQTGQFILHTLSPNLYTFGFSDGGSTIPAMCPTMFWFYNKTKDPSILYNEYRLYQKNGLQLGSRIAPAMILWGSSFPFTAPVKPEKLYWKADGTNPIACMRSSWDDEQGLFLGVKLGTPGANHGHMDVGSFVFSSRGVNWAIDMGGVSYYAYESKGVQIWSFQRWDVFRHTNFAHNTLTFNERKQLLKGHAKILSSSDNPDHMYVVSDLTPVYKSEDQIVKTVRSFSMVDKKYVVIEDKMKSPNHFTKVTWRMVTGAKATVLSDHQVLLEKDGKKLYVHFQASGTNKRLEAKPAQSKFSFDGDLSGTTIITLDMDLPRWSESTIRVYLTETETVPTSFKPVL